LLSKLNNGNIWKGEVIEWWDENLKIKKQLVTYVDGKKYGRFKSWFKNKKISSDGFYKNDLMNGNWKFYYRNGQIKAEGKFIDSDGKNKNKLTNIPTNGRTGTWTSWHEDGSKWSKLSFLNGKKHGLQKNWYENGQKELEGEYNQDIPVNKWSWWYFDGAPMQEGEYSEDGNFQGLYFINPQVPNFSYP